MKITWYHTAALSVQTKQHSVVFDPFLPFKGSKVVFSAEKYDAFPTIVATHAHLDHIVNIPELVERKLREVYGTQAVKIALEELCLEGDFIHKIEWGKSFSIGDIAITPFKGQHIQYDKKTLHHTFFSIDILKYAYNIPPMIRENKICQERGETTAYLIEAEGKKVFVLGSLGLDPETQYPQGMDLLVLPYQGTSDLLTPALEIIHILKPKAVLLDHFDNTFPPLSRDIDTSDIVSALKNVIPVYVLDHGASIEL